MARKKTSQKKSAKTGRKVKSSLYDIVQLQTVRLVGVNTELHMSGHRIPSAAKIELKVGLGINKNDKLLLATVFFDVLAVPSEDGNEINDSSSSRVTMKVVYQVIFEAEPTDVESLSEADASTLKAMSAHIAWPYLRQVTQSLTSMMGIPPIVVPLAMVKPSDGQLLIQSYGKQREPEED